LLPTVVAYWNRINGGIDVFSHNLKNVRSQHKKNCIPVVLYGCV
jgi:hypothetical protein